MTTADDQSVANLQRALRDITDKARSEVDVVKRYLKTGLFGLTASETSAAFEQGVQPRAANLSEWIFDSAGDEVMVCGPQGKPGFKWLKPNEKSLDARLLYALVSTIIKERDAS